MTVGIIMGSSSDWSTMKHSAEMLDYFGISYETKVVSAHRTPEMMVEYAKNATSEGIDIIIFRHVFVAQKDLINIGLHFQLKGTIYF